MSGEGLHAISSWRLYSLLTLLRSLKGCSLLPSWFFPHLKYVSAYKCLQYIFLPGIPMVLCSVRSLLPDFWTFLTVCVHSRCSKYSTIGRLQGYCSHLEAVLFTSMQRRGARPGKVLNRRTFGLLCMRPSHLYCKGERWLGQVCMLYCACSNNVRDPSGGCSSWKIKIIFARNMGWTGVKT